MSYVTRWAWFCKLPQSRGVQNRACPVSPIFCQVIVGPQCWYDMAEDGNPISGKNRISRLMTLIVNFWACGGSILGSFYLGSWNVFCVHTGSLRMCFHALRAHVDVRCNWLRISPIIFGRSRNSLFYDQYVIEWCQPKRDS